MPIVSTVPLACLKLTYQSDDVNVKLSVRKMKLVRIEASFVDHTEECDQRTVQKVHALVKQSTKLMPVLKYRLWPNSVRIVMP